jgi:hypothetical protein
MTLCKRSIQTRILTANFSGPIEGRISCTFLVAFEITDHRKFIGVVSRFQKDKSYELHDPADMVDGASF